MSRASPEPVAIAILAKAPLPGLAKTRLAPALGADGAAALQARLIERAVETAARRRYRPGHAVGGARPGSSRVPDARGAVRRRAGAPARRRPRRPHAGGARGRARARDRDRHRLPGAAARASARRRRGARRRRRRVVVPVEDGGYALIGMREPQPALFADMAWSTAGVMAETRRRLTAPVAVVARAGAAVGRRSAGGCRAAQARGVGGVDGLTWM